MKPLRIPLRVVFYKEREFWIAHCLELDVVGHGSTKREAVKLLIDAIRVQLEATIKHKNLANLFCPADSKFFAMFAAGKDTAVGKLKILSVDYITIEHMDTREYSEADADLAPA